MTEGDSTAKPSISHREYIRWLPGHPTEPTSTLVLTTSTRHFIDIRITKPADQGPDLPNEGGPLSRLAWAFAGTSSTTLRPPQYGLSPPSDSSPPAPSRPSTDPANVVPHCKWTHWIDSHASAFTDESVSDEGDMYPLPDARTLEKGDMVNPETGVKGAYEEGWIDEGVATLPEETAGKEAMLTLHQFDGEREQARGMVVRVGQYVQGLIKVVTADEKVELSCERWEWDEDGGWRRTVKIGRLFLPCAVAFEAGLQEGKEVRYGDWLWKVAESRDVPSIPRSQMVR